MVEEVVSEGGVVYCLVPHYKRYVLTSEQERQQVLDAYILTTNLHCYTTSKIT